MNGSMGCMEGQMEIYECMFINDGGGGGG